MSVITPEERDLWANVLVQSVRDALYEEPDDVDWDGLPEDKRTELYELRMAKEEAIDWLSSDGAEIAEALGICSARLVKRWASNPRALDGEFYRVEEVAEILGVTPQSIRWMCEYGSLDAVPDLFSDNKSAPLLISTQSLDDYMNRQERCVLDALDAEDELSEDLMDGWAEALEDIDDDYFSLEPERIF